MNITLDIELLSILDRRALIINNLPRKKKKRLKKELSTLLIRLLYKESNKIFDDLSAVEEPISSIPRDHSVTNH
jgi:hypothetical protein